MPTAPDTVETCDVLVIGSGASGLATAITAAHHGLDVILAEKAPVFGGTSAWSGGWLWIPRNPLAIRAGIDEDPAEPRLYLDSELGNRARDPRLEVFLQNGPRMVDFFERHSAMRWIDGNRIPDFHESPGCAHGGRSISAAPYDGRALGGWIDKLRPLLEVLTLRGMGIAGGADMAHFLNATRHPASALYVAGRLLKHARDLLLYRRSMQLVGGNALVARLLRSAVDAGVRLWDASPALRLISEAGRVNGAVLHFDGRDIRVVARRGVVLAGGGFPHDRARIARHLPHAPTGAEHLSAAPRTNTGDGLRMAEAAGAGLDFSLAQPMAWAPVSLVEDGKGGTAHFPHLVERAKPGIIAVDGSGRRFVNEADSYHDFLAALLEHTPSGTPPVCWLIADHRAQRRFGLGHAKPFPFPLQAALRSGYLKRAATLRDLAAQCDLPVEALAESVARFNAGALRGEDPEFRRGASAYNRVQGDAGHEPNPALGPLTRAPYYAVRIHPGSLGSFAGIRTGANGQVLDTSGAPIAGLFAVGNDAASIMGGYYPAGGITLGPGMTFGYVVGRVLAGHEVPGLPALTPHPDQGAMT